MAIDFGFLNELDSMNATNQEAAKDTRSDMEKLDRKLAEVGGNDRETMLDMVNLKREKIVKENAVLVAKHYQDSREKAKKLQHDIMQGILTGENTAGLLLKAVECIALITNDTMYYQSAKEALLTVQGEAMKIKEAAELQASHLKEMIGRLEQARTGATEEREIKRLETAIRECKKKIEQLE